MIRRHAAQQAIVVLVIAVAGAAVGRIYRHAYVTNGLHNAGAARTVAG